jgi:hypothetical protein
MGSDPRRLDGLRADERAAALVLERVTGGTVRAHDIGTRQGAYDLHLTLPGGRTAAVEVTTVGRSPTEIADLLTLPHVTRRAAKVTSAGGVDEQHLFIGLGSGDLPDAVHLALAKPSAALGVQTENEMGEVVPAGLSRLWLMTSGRKGTLVSWSLAHGWRVHPA